MSRGGWEVAPAPAGADLEGAGGLYKGRATMPLCGTGKGRPYNYGPTFGNRLSAKS
jgi:hypothetical protein